MDPVEDLIRRDRDRLQRELAVAHDMIAILVRKLGGDTLITDAERTGDYPAIQSVREPDGLRLHVAAPQPAERGTKRGE